MHRSTLKNISIGKIFRCLPQCNALISMSFSIQYRTLQAFVYECAIIYQSALQRVTVSIVLDGQMIANFSSLSLCCASLSHQRLTFPRSALWWFGWYVLRVKYRRYTDWKWYHHNLHLLYRIYTYCFYVCWFVAVLFVMRTLYFYQSG